MAQFDFTILQKLKEKFDSLEKNINEIKQIMKGKEEELNDVSNEMQTLESKKLNIELEIGNHKKELIQLEQLHETTISQYKVLQDSADQLLSLLQD